MGGGGKMQQVIIDPLLFDQAFAGFRAEARRRAAPKLGGDFPYFRFRHRQRVQARGQQEQVVAFAVVLFPEKRQRTGRGGIGNRIIFR